AVRQSTFGRPGASYIDLAADLIHQEQEESAIVYPPKCADPPQSLAPIHLIKSLANVLSTAQRPLVIIGKGSAYNKAENAIRQFINQHQIPFLPTPMGKGVVSDRSPFCVSSARSKALAQADVILLLGARLNWILHFGLPPRFHKDVKILQVDLCMEELHNSKQSSVAVVGDINSVVQQIDEELCHQQWIFPQNSEWWTQLLQKKSENSVSVQQMISDKSTPLNYYAAYHEIQSLIPTDAIIVNEGANTMDIGRTMLLNDFPRHRLDAGTFGTMGVGLGSAIAAALWCEDNSPEKRVICIQGDSAFGFSGMEMGTIYRYHLPVIVIVFNNGGIYFGLEEDSMKALHEEETHLALSVPPNSLSLSAKYDKICEIFGGKGFNVKTVEELRNALQDCLKIKQPCVINVTISPSSQKKPQDFPWLTRSHL
ncbi:2-hydroxyacyl-CoA lyase 1, partial [Trichonephila clavipes]